MKIKKPLLTAIGSFILVGLLTSNRLFASEETAFEDQKDVPFSLVGESPKEKEARLKWWADSRFGLFIHWGLYSVLEGYWEGIETKRLGEWIRKSRNIKHSDYSKLINDFNPVNYDPDKWMELAKEAGMKYVVITSKHHDGFNLWNSKYTDFNIGSTPYKKDLLAPLAAAAKKQGIHFGLYYSIIDWDHPNYAPVLKSDKKDPTRKPNYPLYYEYLKNQTKELLSNYENLELLWFDGEWAKTWQVDNYRMGKDIYRKLRDIKPSLIINERFYGKRDQKFADYWTPEQRIPKKASKGLYYWETCMTMNDTWGYKRDDDNWRPAKMLIYNLIDIASKGGNFLLNIGPKADGSIPKPSIKILKSMGKWMKVNGEAIYGTMGNPFSNPEKTFAYGKITTKSKENKVYLHLTKWPYKKEYKPYKMKDKSKKSKRHKKDFRVSFRSKLLGFFKKGPKHKKIVLNGFENKIKRIYALQDKTKSIEWGVNNNAIEILSKNIPKSKMVTVLAIEYEGDLQIK